MKTTTRPRPLRWLGGITLAGALAAPALLIAAPSAFADYGPGACTIEISDNAPGGVPATAPGCGSS